ncbi:squalene monooxygenase-like [Pyrus ussuriensis x Pyrus communis]|uniref:Squalene monooxygenase n=1 Tax=Pyrus ussuriensis x Pyrus communis TaxID=2448454 RepID=A0A5N5FTE4_9ROSA|nr:squalene monooxygenase-like [Pyrus ussuriensis x Pyrus communis]
MLVAVVAFLLGFVSSYSFRRKKKDRASVKDRNVNGWRSSENGMCLQKDIGAGALLMGDAVNMRHPITGGGMVVALSDVVVLRNLLRPLRNLNDVPALFKYLESFYTLRKSAQMVSQQPAAFTINTLAGAAYKVLCASPDPARKKLRQACFDYFCLGRIFSNGALAAFSGLNYCPWSLVLYFFGYLCCWTLANSVSFTKTYMDCSQTNLGE